MRLFGKSPFKPLHEHTLLVRKCVKELRGLVENFSEDGDKKKLNETVELISKLENDADTIKRNIREHLPKTFFMPVERSDILLFLREQDKIADSAQDLGRVLEVRPQTKLPRKLKKETLELTDKVIETVEALRIAVKELDNLLSSSFSKHETKKILKLIARIDKKEWDADQVNIKLMKKLFEMEKELDPVTVIHLEKIFHILDSVADKAEDAGDRLRSMVAKR
jgi:hypothetical protein